jgi:hypothetical protein
VNICSVILLCYDSTEHVVLSFRTTEWLQIVTMIYFAWVDLEGQRKTMIQPGESSQVLRPRECKAGVPWVKRDLHGRKRDRYSCVTSVARSTLYTAHSDFCCMTPARV